MATESVLIDAFGTMNSKSEFRNNKISRIVVEDPRKRKQDKREDEEEHIIKGIELLKKELEANKKVKLDAKTLLNATLHLSPLVLGRSSWGTRPEPAWNRPDTGLERPEPA